MSGYPWSKRELYVLERYYSSSEMSELKNRLNRVLPKGYKKRTTNAIHQKAKEIGVKRRPDGMIPLVDVCKYSGIDYGTSRYYLVKNSNSLGEDVLSLGFSSMIFVSVGLAEKLETMFKPCPDHYIRAVDASKKLGFKRDYLTQVIIKANSIPWHQCGNRYFVPDWIIKACNDYLMRTGCVYVKWVPAISDYAKKGFTFRHREAQEFIAQRLKSG